MSWDTAVDDLRIKLSDGPTDRLRAFKKALGIADGTNTRFKTFEYRRYTDFTVALPPEGIYINSIPLPATGVATDATGSGFFTLLAPPDANATVEATYYLRWFLDNELDEFLRIANNWLGMADDYSNLDTGLRPSALDYAAAEAYTKMAMRWVEAMSEVYLLQDAPRDAASQEVNYYKGMADLFRKNAKSLRDDFYTRQGQSLSPLRAFYTRGVIKTEPNR